VLISLYACIIIRELILYSVRSDVVFWVFKWAIDCGGLSLQQDIFKILVINNSAFGLVLFVFIVLSKFAFPLGLG